jgi:hypothetical protein
MNREFKNMDKIKEDFNEYLEDKILKHMPTTSNRSDCCNSPCNTDYMICKDCGEHCDIYNEENEEVKEFRIDGKGYFGGAIKQDSIIPYLDVCDIEYGSGYIKFKGTETQLDNFLIELGKNQMYFKAIGVHTIKS